jgi:predicted secreted protein
MAPVKLIATSVLATSALILALVVISSIVGTQAFGMRLSGALGLYFIIWWTMLFAVLPFGVRSQVEEGAVTAGTEPGAPALPRLREKAIWTTFVASAVFISAAAILPLAGL